MMQDLHPHASSIREWLREAAGQPLLRALQDMRRRKEKEIRRGSVDVEIYRAQGALEVLDLLVGLDDRLTEYLRDVMAGKIQPVRPKVPAPGGKNAVV